LDPKTLLLTVATFAFLAYGGILAYGFEYSEGGIQVVGKSLNPPKKIHTYDGTGTFHTVTLTSKTTGTDESGNQWILDGFWLKVITMPSEPDEKTMHGFDRRNNQFSSYVDQQKTIAKETMRKILRYVSVQNEDYGKNYNKQILSEYLSRSENPKLQADILKERIKASELFNRLYSIST